MNQGSQVGFGQRSLFVDVARLEKIVERTTRHVLKDEVDNLFVTVYFEELDNVVVDWQFSQTREFSHCHYVVPGSKRIFHSFDSNQLTSGSFGR